MQQRIMLVVLLVFLDTGCRRPSPPPRRTGFVAAFQANIGPCGGFLAGVAPATMDSRERRLATLIANYRSTIGYSTGSENSVLVGVAKFHANDMAARNYVGLVASDGEDVFRRIRCSNLNPTNVAVMAIAYSTSPDAVFRALRSKPEASRIISDNIFTASLSVGYKAGYWMVTGWNGTAGLCQVGGADAGRQHASVLVKSAACQDHRRLLLARILP